MGRESLLARMPKSCMAGASCAPMENSPPGIHAIPSGVPSGVGAAFDTVGRKFTLLGAGSGADAATVGLAIGECVDAVLHNAIAESNMRIPTAKRKRPRMFETSRVRLMFLCFFPMTCASLLQLTFLREPRRCWPQRHPRSRLRLRC